MEDKQCIYIKSDGQQCGAKPIKGSSYCFSHNPDTQIEKHLAVMKGGLNSKKVSLDLAPLEIKDAKDVAVLLEHTINGVRSGEIPPNIANTIGYLAGHALKAIELAKYADKVENVERVLFERKVTR
jgi:hypothetical protein